MVEGRASVVRLLVRLLGVYAVVCVAVFAGTRTSSPLVAEYGHLAVAAVFLLSAVRLTRHDPVHYGVALGGLLVPPADDRPRGPLGLWDLGRAIRDAAPSAARELGVAVAIGAVVFPLYAAGYFAWTEPSAPFAWVWPPNVIELAVAQLVLIALPEEAFFRGYIQTTLSDAEPRRVRILGASLAPGAWLGQAALFALVHLIAEPEPSRLLVFFPGLLFGWVRALRGGIGAAIALHAMSNLCSEILARSWL